MSKNTSDLQKEIETLGIIGIEADGNLTQGLVEDAVRAIKEIDVDFASLAKQTDEYSKKYGR